MKQKTLMFLMTAPWDLPLCRAAVFSYRN